MHAPSILCQGDQVYYAVTPVAPQARPGADFFFRSVISTIEYRVGLYNDRTERQARFFGNLCARAGAGDNCHTEVEWIGVHH